MRVIRVFVVLLVFLTTASYAFAHGFSMVLSPDHQSMIPTSEAPLVVGGKTYNDTFFDQFSGGPDPVQSFEGFAFATFSFGSLKDPEFSFNVISPVLYSNGGAATPAFVDPSNPNHLATRPDGSAFPDVSTYVQIYDLDIPSPNINVYGNTSPVTGFSVTANDPHELEKTLFQFSGQQGDGVYGFAFQFVVQYTNAQGGTSTLASGPLIDLYNTPNFQDDATIAQQNTAGLAIYNAIITPVPEPATWALLAIGTALCVGAKRIRSNRRK